MQALLTKWSLAGTNSSISKLDKRLVPCNQSLPIKLRPKVQPLCLQAYTELHGLNAVLHAASRRFKAVTVLHAAKSWRGSTAQS